MSTSAQSIPLPLKPDAFFHAGVLIDRAHYYAILVQGEGTNRGGALTEGVRELI